MDVLIIGRVAERLIVVITGTLAIFWGYRLFMASVLMPQHAELARGHWKLILKGVGPGIFFSLFGAVIVCGSWRSPLVVEPINPVKAPTVSSNMPNGFVYAEGVPAELLLPVRALNTAIKLSSAKDVQAQGVLLSDLQLAGPTLESLRRKLLMNAFGTSLVEKWDQLHTQYLNDSASLSQPDRTALDKLRPYFLDSFSDEPQP